MKVQKISLIEIVFILVALVGVLLLAVEVKPQTLRSKFEKPQTSISKLKTENLKLKTDFWRPMGPGTIATSALCFGGAAADLATTLGKGEANPLFRNSRGQLNVPLAVGVGFGFCGGTILLEKLIPGTVKWTHAMRLVSGGAHLASAVRNIRIK